MAEDGSQWIPVLAAVGGSCVGAVLSALTTIAIADRRVVREQALSGFALECIDVMRKWLQGVESLGVVTTSEEGQALLEQCFRVDPELGPAHIRAHNAAGRARSRYGVEWDLDLREIERFLADARSMGPGSEEYVLASNWASELLNVLERWRVRLTRNPLPGRIRCVWWRIRFGNRVKKCRSRGPGPQPQRAPDRDDSETDDDLIDD